MLQIVTADGIVPLHNDKFWIQEEMDGKDSFGLTISIDDSQYPLIAEEVEAIDSETGIRYIFRSIDEGVKTAACKGSICLDALRADMFIDYDSGSNRAPDIVRGVLPAGWDVVDKSEVTIRRTVTLEGGTAIDVIDAVQSTFGICARYDNAAKTVTLINPETFTTSGTYLTEELNLKTCNYKGNSKDFATRLYMRGKDGITFASINDGKDYVEDHTYSDKVVSTVWIDERYSVLSEMLDAAKRKLHALAVPSRSYECSVIDLARAKEGDASNTYAHLDFSLFTVATLLDGRRGRRVDHQIVRIKRFPNYPEENVVTLSTLAVNVQSKVNTAFEEVTSPNSSFKGSIQSIIDSVASSISDYNGGNLEITKNTDGKPNGLRIMDTEDKATAKKIMWLNLKGITYSSNGIDGPYSSVWSFEEGGFIGDWIVAGKILADLITTGTIKDKLGNFFADLDNGVVKINAKEFSLDGNFVSDQGRNFILDSAFCRDSNYSKTGASYTLNGDELTITTDKSTYMNYTKAGSVQCVNSIRGKTVSAAYDYKVDAPIVSGVRGQDGTADLWVACTARTTIVFADGTIKYFDFEPLDGSVTNGWIRRSITFTVPDKEIQSVGFMLINQGVTGTIQLRHPSLELGSVASAWSTAPEDASSVSGSSGDQTSIFNKLTGRDASQGLYIKDGKLYINAEYIAVGILSAIKIQSRDGSSYWDLAKNQLSMNGNFESISGNYAFKLWAAVMRLLDGENMRVRIYTTGADNSQGIVQVFSGTVPEEGTMQYGSRVSQLQAELLEVGSDSQGNYSGAVRCGSVSSGAISATGDVSMKDGILGLTNYRIRPNAGKNSLYTNWVRVNGADGQTYWALCGFDYPQ